MQAGTADSTSAVGSGSHAAPGTRTGGKSKRNARYDMKHENTSQSASFPMLKNASAENRHI